MSETAKRERFGRYLILDHLVDGGMAKICRARFLGEQADKVVAIKMVQPQYSKDEAFKTMFMDEIKVTFGLLHPNIVQTYDYGIQHEQLFVAMEYCDGRNLKEYLEKLKERKFVFPVEISTYIISQACQGLFYAHTYRDKLTGEETHIIHRDISPHNIMLTYDGAIKIIDFGIAKSQRNTEATQAGTIKGKLSYLAPEYLDGLELDARYDQFALGITLWEMLCSRKLFKENNDLAVLKKIQECKVPAPSSINPNVPKELDEIVLKALSKDRNKRYENLDQLNRALMKFLYAKYPDFNGTDLSYFAQELFREEIKKDREKLFEFGKIDIKPYIEDFKNESDKGSNKSEPKEKEKEKSSSSEGKSEAPAFKKAQVLDFGFEDASEIKANKGKIKTSTVKKGVTSKEKTFPDNSELSKNIADRNNTQLVQLKKSAQTKSGATSTKLNNSGTKVFNNPMNQKTSKKSPLAAIAVVVLLVVGLGAYMFITNKQEKEQAEIALANAKAEKLKAEKKKANSRTTASAEEIEAEKGTITLTHFDRQKMQVFVEDEKIDPDLVGTIKVPMRKEFTLRVQIDGKKHFIKAMSVENKAVIEIEIPEMPTIPYGYIRTSSACAKGEITFELWGEKRKSAIPMVASFGIPLPLQIDSKGQAGPAKFVLYFKRENDSFERKIDIELTHEDETIDLCEKI